MKAIIVCAVMIGIVAAVELAFGVSDWGGRVALAVLVWCCLSVVVGLIVGRLIEGASIAGRDNEEY